MFSSPALVHRLRDGTPDAWAAPFAITLVLQQIAMVILHEPLNHWQRLTACRTAIARSWSELGTSNNYIARLRAMSLPVPESELHASTIWRAQEAVAGDYTRGSFGQGPRIWC